MKNFIIFITVLIFFISSCASKPNVDSSFSVDSETNLSEDEISESPETEDESLVPVFYEELMADIFEGDILADFFDDGLNGISETADEITFEEEPIDEIFEETEEIAESETSDDLLSDIEPEQEIAADEPTIETGIAAISDPPVQTTQPPVQPPAQPPVQPPVQQTQPPAQQPPSQPPPVQPAQPAQPPVQTIQPPVQQPPTQPPAQPPALLGSAEERNPLREPQIPPPPRDPLRDALADSAAREQNVTPGQTLVIPGDGGIYFSRVVRATVGQIIEIPFNGSGWVYIGELASRRGVVYNSRRLDSEGQTFIFRAEEAGSYALKFFKQDFIRDYILNDHVQVIVGEAPAGEGTGWFNPPIDRGRVTAQPRWPSAIDEAEMLRSGSILGSVSDQPPVNSQPPATSQPPVATQPPAAAQPPATSQPPVTTQPPAASERFPPDVLLQRARESFDAGNVAGAVSLLDQYALYYSETDELYWLYGQFYEANSPSRNILLSLDYYRRLVREYPQSTRYNDARSRIAYLERYYINIQ
jgi:hypothetical protein